MSERYGSYDVMLANPPEPASTGTCDNCGEDLVEWAFELTEWPKKDAKVCYICASNWVIEHLRASVLVDDEDILPILQSVDEIAKCKDCYRFVCRCP